ncbi:MAG: class I SAM-dependent methyltransferase [Armatimonadetes bacterium]|nr:class I SAM-dependent methyltransferase [Armatimonadota bacterium]
MFRKSAAYYDALYAWKDYKGEARRLHALIWRYKRSPGNALLDVACGTGGHITFLKGRYAVEGLDLDPRLLAIARRKHPDVVYHRGDMVRFALGRRFDVVTCLFSAIGYATTLSRLRPGGRDDGPPPSSGRRADHRALADPRAIQSRPHGWTVCRSPRPEGCPDECHPAGAWSVGPRLSLPGGPAGTDQALHRASSARSLQLHAICGGAARRGTRGHR